MKKIHDETDYIVNPATNRKVLKTGKIGRQLCATLINPLLQLYMPCLHNLTGPACAKCCTNAMLSFCEMCNIVGPMDALKRHASMHHPQPKPEYPEIDTNICGCGVEFVTSEQHNPIKEHAREPVNGERNPEHVLWEARVPCSKLCPHPEDTWKGGFCRVCMTRMDGHGWRCACCSSRSISPPEPHFINGPRVCEPQKYFLNWNCGLCDASFPSRQSQMDHIWSHVQLRSVCRYGGKSCRFGVRELAASNETYVEHCNRVHGAASYNCVLGYACTLKEKCKSARTHVIPMGIHNLANTMERLPVDTPTDARLTSLISKPGLAHHTDVRAFRKRVDELLAHADYKAIDYTTATCAQAVNSGGLPFDILTLIFKQLDIASLFIMTKVSHQFREMADDIVDTRERFEFNLRRAVTSEHTTMTVTRAKDEFMLNDADLLNLRYESKQNPYSRSAAPMRLYSLEDLYKKTMDKYETWEHFKERRDKRKQTSTVRALTHEENQKERRAELKRALAVYGLELRTDSTQCDRYINTGRGVNGENLDGVVKVMRQMNFYYNETSYTKFVGQLKYEYREFGERYDMDFILEESKKEALQQWRLDHPGKILDFF